MIKEKEDGNETQLRGRMNASCGCSYSQGYKILVEEQQVGAARDMQDTLRNLLTPTETGLDLVPFVKTIA